LKDFFPLPVVHIRRPDIADALVIPPLILKLDELCHGRTQLLEARVHYRHGLGNMIVNRKNRREGNVVPEHEVQPANGNL
jgi:hypothetical protein